MDEITCSKRGDNSCDSKWGDNSCDNHHGDQWDILSHCGDLWDELVGNSGHKYCPNIYLIHSAPWCDVRGIWDRWYTCTR